MLELEPGSKEGKKVRIDEYFPWYCICSDSFANIYFVIEGDASHTAQVRRHYNHAAHGVCALQSSSLSLRLA